MRGKIRAQSKSFIGRGGKKLKEKPLYGEGIKTRAVKKKGQRKALESQ